MTTDKSTSTKMHPKKALLWVSQASIVMMFGGLTSAVVVAQTPEWFSFDMPIGLWLSSALIILSSVTMNWGVSTAKKGNLDTTVKAVGLTFLLGLAFAWSQFAAWDALVDAKAFFAGTDASASFMYVITGLHLAHLAGGLIALVVVWFKANKKLYTPGNTLGLELASIYWHFLDGLWLYLFLFLLFVR